MTAGGRYLIAIGVPECAKMPELAPLELVKRDVERITDLLTDKKQGYERVLADRIPLGATSAEMRPALYDWFGADERDENDHVIVYFAGHGDVDGNRFGEHCLLTSDARPQRLDTVFLTEEFARIFFNGRIRFKNILLILDVCFAGTGSTEAMLRALKKTDTRGDGAGFWILASTSSDSLAFDGAFVDAFSATLCDSLHTPTKGSPYLSPNDIAVAVNRWFREHHKPQAAGCDLVGGKSDALFFRNPGYQANQDQSGAEGMTFWKHASSGADVPGDDTCFVGRLKAIEDCEAWLADSGSPHSALVVTGMPGSGKSALLGKLILETGPSRNIRYDARLRAKDETLLSFTHKLAVALQCTAREPLQLLAEINRAGRGMTILIDGLDESREPDSLEHGLLRGLADCQGIKLLLATRKRGNRIPLEERALVLDIDAAPYFDKDDLVSYIHTRLRADVRSPGYAEPGQAAHARALAEHLASASGTSFLYARMACRAMLRMGRVIDTSAPGWHAQVPIPKDIKGAYLEDFTRFDAIKRRRFLSLLTPLAYARGSGLPFGPLWLAIAGAFDGSTYTRDHLLELEEEAGFYLVQDVEEGRSVFRLFHQTFVVFLKERDRHSDIDSAFFTALDAYARAGKPSFRFDERTEPYIRRHFAAHAASAGQLDRYLDDPDLLTTIAPADLLPMLHMTVSARGRALAAAYKRACHWIRLGDTEKFLCYFALACADYGQGSVMGAINAFNKGACWHPLSVLGTASSTSQIYARGDDVITALALSTDRQGIAVAICGYSTGRVAIRSLHNDELLLEIADPSQETSGAPRTSIRSIEALSRNNCRYIAVAYSNTRLAMFSISHDWTECLGNAVRDVDLRAFCFTERSGSPVLVTCGKDALSVWSVPDLECLQTLDSAAEGTMYGITAFRLGGRNMLAIANDTMRQGEHVTDDILRIRDVENLGLNRKIGHIRMGLGMKVQACSIAQRLWLVLTDLRGASLIVDPVTGACSHHPAHYDLASNTQGLGEICYYRAELEKTIAVSCLYERLTFALLRTSPDNPDEVLLEFCTPAQALESDVCRVTDDGALVVTGAKKQLRAYRLDEIFESPVMATDSFQSYFSNRNIRRSVCHGQLTYVGDNTGGASCWRSNGERVWYRPGTGRPVRGLAVSTTAERPYLAVATSDGTVELLTPETGELQSSLKLPGEITDVRLSCFNLRDYCFVNICSMFDNYHFYAVRVWDLATGEEIDTEVPRPQHERQARTRGISRMFEFDRGEPRHAFAMDDYLKQKSTPAAALHRHGDQLLVLCGGAYGEVRAFDFETLDEVDAWTSNTEHNNARYVHAIATLSVGDLVVVMSGDDSGGICMHRLNERDSMLIENNAHIGNVSAIAVLTGETPAFASAGRDGVLNIWNLDLRLVERIEFGVPIVRLQAIGMHELVVTTLIGIILLHIDTNKKAELTE